MELEVLVNDLLASRQKHQSRRVWWSEAGKQKEPVPMRDTSSKAFLIGLAPTETYLPTTHSAITSMIISG